MKSWLMLLIGLAAAAGAAWVLLRGREPVGPPLDEIDDASRARLEQVLRDSERPRE